MIYKEFEKNGLSYTVFTPDPIMGASATLVEKDGEGFLIDTQFSKLDAQAIIDHVTDKGIKLTQVFITHSDPDFYFGLPFIKDVFPDVKSYATAETIKRIKETADDKLMVWKDVLKENTPTTIIIPDERADSIGFKDQQFSIVGRDKSRTALYNKEAELLIGGITVITDTHVFMADTKTIQMQNSWINDLEELHTLAITTLIPGHFGNGNKLEKDNLTFTLDYIKRFIESEEHFTTSRDIILDMKSAYPELSEGTLELSAKVVTGEMDWQ
ncbi:MBL fold metallo-hydrolase [Vagococcus coleopterorum]|uniref:MBL fold metallo-hydrolase n=1 Tax=Vagococcus coleopterorum TaxID=2714946 RepID=A0A6G8AP80_9ENTE|nr:MBL fold metallo-hydrolase [Vagococcus coleopterorum]QIL46797.1 MBL fold metallo-hydrolase [Vagococcus coleopterorum]